MKRLTASRPRGLLVADFPNQKEFCPGSRSTRANMHVSLCSMNWALTHPVTRSTEALPRGAAKYMTLQPESQGVWVGNSWQPGLPGTFAVIVGVSAYQHLDGSPGKFRLGQLFVSALTAFKFLDWLKTDYRRTGSPLAKCWLLLSPTAAELKANSVLSQQNSIEPTFDNCSLAIQQWFAEMAQLSGDSAARSRSVFFFSGHGLEVVEDSQILLPSDYLRPGTPVDRAISTSNISRGLKALQVPTHFLFLDA